VNPMEFVFGIVFIAIVAGTVKSIFRDRLRPRNDGEAERLRAEVQALKERLAVIERITVEKENSLEREIERLRDR
jgi:hypothetical protein